jgi:tetraacyldisaccharide 4'-kinase
MQALLSAAKSAGMRGPIRSTAVAREIIEASAGAPHNRVASLRGAPVFLLAGIARPERFAETVRALGAEIRGSRDFADHHRVTAAELVSVRKSALGAGATRILTTEKDAARIAAAEMLGTPTISPLPIELEILAGEETLTAALDALFRETAT